MNLSGGETRKCRLRDMLYVPDLPYNSVSVSKASEARKVDETGCQFLNSDNKVIATAVRCGSLYLLNCRSREQASVAVTKEDIWHRRYGHLCGQNLRKLAVDLSG